MKKIAHLIPLLFAAILFGCDAESTKSSTEKTEVTDQNTPHDLSLNNGERWMVDDHMMQIIKEIEEAVVSFDGNQLNEIEELAVHISDLIDELTSNCTMEGQAHDELHKWLLPFIDLSDELSNSEDVPSAIAFVDQMKTEFEIFNRYFR